MRAFRFMLMFLLPSLLLPGFSNLAGQPAVCPVAVEAVLQSLDEVCDAVDRNAACYGNRLVTTTFAEEVPDDFFSAVGDQARLRTLKTLTTAAANAETGDWGVALMNVQANIPNTLPGQAAIFVLMGDTEIENAVSPEAALELPDPITVHTAAPAPLYTAPDESSELLGVTEVNAELLADVLSEDGLWARVGFQDRPAWVFSISLLEELALGQLPAIDRDAFTPMQAFYFRTGIGQSECEQAPDLLLVQGPEQFAVDIQANGADIRIGSTAVLKGSEVIALSGEVVIFPDTPNAVTIPAGHGASLCLEEGRNLGTDGQANDSEVIEGCLESPPAPLDEGQREKITVVEQIPAAVVNYPVALEVPADFSEAPCTPNPEWAFTYTIRPGDTLSAIAVIFNLDTATLMAGNCLSDTLILSGQNLRVPFHYVPPPPTPTPEPTPIPPTPDTSIDTSSPTSNDFCGDGVCNASVGESRSSCPNDCGSSGGGGSGAVCGNSIVEGGEQCDDGNLNNGDGCSSICKIEAICGDAVVEPPEQCDDGNTNGGDGCSASCMIE